MDSPALAFLETLLWCPSIGSASLTVVICIALLFLAWDGSVVYRCHLFISVKSLHILSVFISIGFIPSSFSPNLMDSGTAILSHYFDVHVVLFRR